MSRASSLIESHIRSIRAEHRGTGWFVTAGRLTVVLYDDGTLEAKFSRPKDDS